MTAKAKAYIIEKPGTASARISAPLLAWYDIHARALPWRALPGTNWPDPYHVWLSEIMLQQTTVAAVKPYFAKFLARWPTAGQLAAAPNADIMAAWAGLGYYARARNLLKCARHVADELGGKFPASEAELRKLPGIGAYTAAAIAAIAFGERAVVVDANVERVVARLFAIATPLPAARPLIRAATDTITPDTRAGDFAQAMMDLGATICRVREPDCPRCPLSGECAAYRANAATDFPVKAPKKAKPERRGTVFWIERGENIWLVTRAKTGMLAGMRALPSDDWSVRRNGSGPAADDAPLAGPWRIQTDAVHHVFTHFSLVLDLARYGGKDFNLLPSHGTWWPVDRLDEAGLPTLFVKAAQAAAKN